MKDDYWLQKAEMYFRWSISRSEGAASRRYWEHRMWEAIITHVAGVTVDDD